jgi:hypothetical protein
MVYDNHLWYSPGYLIECGIQADKRAKTNGTQLSAGTVKVVNETRTGALFALGLTVRDKRVRYVQPVDPKEGAPDVRIVHQTDSPLKNYDWGAYVDVEIVRYEDHTQISIDEFLKNKKLTPKKAYQDGTIILCGIDKTISSGKLWKDIAKELAPIKNKLDTFLIGRTHPTKLEIAMARVHPSYDSVTQFDTASVIVAYYKGVKGTQIINLRGNIMKNPPGAGFNPFTDSV